MSTTELAVLKNIRMNKKDSKGTIYRNRENLEQAPKMGSNSLFNLILKCSLTLIGHPQVCVYPSLEIAVLDDSLLGQKHQRRRKEKGENNLECRLQGRGQVDIQMGEQGKVEICIWVASVTIIFIN